MWKKCLVYWSLGCLSLFLEIAYEHISWVCLECNYIQFLRANYQNEPCLCHIAAIKYEMIISGKTADLETKLGETCVQLSLVILQLALFAKGWVRQKGWARALSSEFWFGSMSVSQARGSRGHKTRSGIKNDSQRQGFSAHKDSDTHAYTHTRPVRSSHNGRTVGPLSVLRRKNQGDLLSLSFFHDAQVRWCVLLCSSQFEVLRSTRVGRRKWESLKILLLPKVVAGNFMSLLWPSCCCGSHFMVMASRIGVVVDWPNLLGDTWAIGSIGLLMGHLDGRVQQTRDSKQMLKWCSPF